MAVKVAIIGATGYNGLELIRILARHRGAEIVYLGTRATGEPPISTVHPSLLKICDLPAEPIDAGVVA
ncbi:MAG: N-acetyl-gamma-glutamyl-phosphate reductase, partial [Planctomycetota bacterium]